jgi:transglutaminase-like putative cysteine protease
VLKLLMMRKLATILTFLATILATNAYAADEFGTKYNITYEVQPTGTTYVKQNVEIINKQKDVIATNYSLSIRQLRIFDVESSTKDAEIEIKEETDKTVIKAEFKDFAIGQYKAKALEINYKTNDITNRVGEVWNVNIPKIQNLDFVDEYNVILKIPKSMGPQIYISPNPLKSSEENDFNVYYFNKTLLNNIGIDGAFGQKQVLNFKLDYVLQNNSVFVKNMQVALPPEIEKQQRVFYKSIDPKPNNIIIDPDGNFLAQYLVGSKQTIKIRAIGSAEIYGQQIIPSFGGKFDQIQPELINHYTHTDLYWETDDEKVQKLAAEFKDENKTVSENAWKIYDYITKNLEYDFNLVKKDYIDRNGAALALSKNDQWACMEFTDSFIAIARAMGIPAREINGYAYAGEGENKPISIGFKSGDVLHAWPEFYDPAFGWVAIDPTWGATSGLDYFTRLDTNHFVFVRKGIDSVYPLPAGAYKIDGTEKQVEVAHSLQPTTQKIEKEAIAFNTLMQNPAKLIKGERAYYVQNAGNATLRVKNNEINELIPPFSVKKVYTNKIELPKSSSNEYLFGSSAKSVMFYAIAFVSALVLCTILLLSIIHSSDLKKLPRRLRRRPQAPSQ